MLPVFTTWLCFFFSISSRAHVRVMRSDGFLAGSFFPVQAVFHTAILNDTLFLNIVNIVDYSIVVGLDEERRELVSSDSRSDGRNRSGFAALTAGNPTERLFDMFAIIASVERDNSEQRTFGALYTYVI